MKCLYDVHCHAFHLHHPGFLGVINRFLLRGSVRVQDLVERKYFRIIRRFIFPAGKPLRIILSAVLSLLVIFFVGAFVSLFLAAASALGFDVFSASLLLQLVLVSASVFAAVAFMIGVVIAAVSILRSRRSGPTTLFRSLFNLLSLVENDIERQFLFLELDVMRRDPDLNRLYVRPYLRLFKKYPSDIKTEINKISDHWSHFSSGFLFSGERYKKMVITPLIMDFGYREFDEFAGIIHYDTPPAKPVVRQVIDLYNGIFAYEKTSLFRVLDIRPFFGLNPRNYPLGVRLPVKTELEIPSGLEPKCLYVINASSIPSPSGRALVLIQKLEKEERERLLQANSGNSEIHMIERQLEHLCETAFEIRSGSAAFPRFNTLPKMLHKYFATAASPRAHRPASLTVKDTSRIPGGFFHGIKVYPPLGFDPWPAFSSGEQDEEHKKVRFLYEFCLKWNLPITAHCSDGGWMVAAPEHARLWTSPERWIPVLEEYQKLTLNFAHFGAQSQSKNKQWRRIILDLMCRFDNVYSDLSFIGHSKTAYEELAGCIDEYCSVHPAGELRLERILKRILFGTDFLIHLLRTESYCRYLKIFEELTDGKSGGSPARKFFENRMSYITENPRRFLSRTSGID